MVSGESFIKYKSSFLFGTPVILLSCKALEELNKINDDETVYKYAGSILVKSNKKTLIDEIEEKQELAKTRSTILAKQEERVKQTLKDQEAKINEMMKSGTAGATQQPKT